MHEVAVIHLETLPVGTLANADIKRAHDRLRKRLHRLGFAGSILIGGTEVAWLARARVWILHVDLLAIGVPREAWEALEGQLAGSGRFDPLRVDELQNPERQLSYALKFATYHRPGKIGRNGRAQAYPPAPVPPRRTGDLVVSLSAQGLRLSVRRPPAGRPNCPRRLKRQRRGSWATGRRQNVPCGRP